MLNIVIAVVLMIVFCLLIIAERKNKQKAKELERRQKEVDKLLDKERLHYLSSFDKSPEELAGMPGDADIGPDGYPKERGASGWGAKYTFFYTPTGKVFHKSKTCYKYGLIPINAWTVCNSHYYPCSRCQPSLPDLSWFSRYKKILEIMASFDITPKPYIAPSTDFQRAEIAERKADKLENDLRKANDRIEYYKSLNIEQEIELRAADLVRTRVSTVLHKGLFQKTLVSFDFNSKTKIDANSRLLRAHAESAEIIPPIFVKARIKGKEPQPYEVTLDSCTCKDFERTRHPCKHMYRLALELGLLLSIQTDTINSALSRLSKEYMQNQKAISDLRKLKSVEGNRR